MANYFLVENQTQLMYTRRFLDGVYCLLQTPCKSSQLETTVTSIQFIQSAITSGRYFEITEMLAKASAIATSENNSRVYAKIKEYSCFWLKNSLNLLQYPSCLFTLALNLPPGFCNSLRSDAANFQSSTIRMLNVSKPNDVCSFVKIGRHPVAIVSLSVQITRSLGKCCFSASTDGTIKAWDIMSYLPIGILLDAPFEEVQVEQVFYLNNCQHVVFGCNDQFIYVYDLRTKILIQKTSYDLGKFFSTTGRHGIWTCHESNLKFIPIDDHKNITNHESGQSLNGYCNEILFTSFDHSKAAVYSEKLGGILILSTENAHVLCRFKDELISSKSIGQFSSTRNHVGATRSDQSIMVWKIDSHSRVSLLAPPHVDLGHIKSLTFSSDEKLICAGCFNYRQGNIIVGNISTGKWIKLLCANVESPMHNLGLVTFPNSSERIIGTYKDQIFVSNSAKITARNPDLAKVRRLDHLSESISEIALVGDLFYTLSRHESYIISWANEKSIIEFPSRINSFLIDEYIFLATDVSIIVSREVEIIITIEQEYPVKTIKTYRHSPSSYSIVVILQENTLKWYTINTNSFEFKLKYVLKDIQLIPLNPFTSTGNAIYVCHDDTIELISIENKILKTFKTWGSESIVYLYSSRDQIVYCTRNIVYLEDVIVSACGSLPDNYYIHSVKSHNGSVGYHATDKLDSLERVVVIKDNKRDGVYNQKCCILEWYFVDVGIVTIATDDMIRVFKGNQVAIYCFDARITTLVYNDSVFFVGDVDGNVQKIKLITG